MKRRLASLLAASVLVAGMAFVSVGVAAASAAPVASDPDSLGTDFWLGFPGNADTPTLKLLITGPTAATGTISAPGVPFSAPFTVTPGTVTSVTVPAGLDIGTSEVVENLGIHVTADQEVAVHGLSAMSFSTDGYLGLPTDALGTEYIVLGYTNVGSFLTEFAVVASQDATTVTINPTAATPAHPIGTPYTVDLDQGQTYQVRADGGAVAADLSGSIVASDKPIAVYGGHQCAQIGTPSCITLSSRCHRPAPGAPRS